MRSWIGCEEVGYESRRDVLVKGEGKLGGRKGRREEIFLRDGAFSVLAKLNAMLFAQVLSRLR